MLQLIVVASLLALAFVVGGYLERRNFKDLDEREAQDQGRLTTGIKRWDAVATFLDQDAPGFAGRPIARSDLAVGSVVVSVDYFKQFLASWRMLFGGEVRSYSSLVERARREAIARMKESAPHADLFLGVRIETSSISQGARKQLGTVEAFAYGTAVRFVRTISEVPTAHSTSQSSLNSSNSAQGAEVAPEAAEEDNLLPPLPR